MRPKETIEPRSDGNGERLLRKVFEPLRVRRFPSRSCNVNKMAWGKQLLFMREAGPNFRLRSALDGKFGPANLS
jgi:hypothetical protein